MSAMTTYPLYLGLPVALQIVGPMHADALVRDTTSATD
jgi:hypothetical protein